MADSPLSTPLSTPGWKQITLPHVSKDVNDLLLWRDPKKSGAVFGGITLAFLLFGVSGLSPLAILAYLLLVVVILALLWAQAGGFVSKGGPPVPVIFKNGIDDEQWSKLSTLAHGYVNKALSVAGVILSGKDPKVSVQVGSALYGIAQLASRVSILGTAYAAVVLAFVLPKVYELKKDEIDKRLDVVVSKGKELYRKVDEAVLRKIPAAKKAA